MGAGNGPGLREIELVLCVWLTKCVANSVADCKETNRKSRRRRGQLSSFMELLSTGFCAVQNAFGPQTHTVLDPLHIYIHIYFIYIYVYAQMYVGVWPGLVYANI